MAEPAPVNPGDVLAGKYRVERVLGMGGMGVVVAATHLELGQLVALKFLLPAAELNAEATARFIREARAAVRISSEHVARVTDVGAARERRAVHGYGVSGGRRPGRARQGRSPADRRRR